MSAITHTGTVDASEDYYLITGVDRQSHLVTVNFAYQGCSLHHVVSVENPQDAQDIVQAVEGHYAQFKVDVDSKAGLEPLPDEVAALLWNKRH